MPSLDRSIWISLGSGLVATAFVFGLSGNVEASVVTAIASFLSVALLFDAIERRTSEAAPRHAPLAPGGPSLDQIDTLLQALPHPAFIVERGRIERSNKAALSLLGKHISGQDVRLALRYPAAMELLTGENRTTTPARVEIIGLGAPGQSWELDVQPIGNERLLAQLFDQSGRQATERMRVDFVANASHELRTPLASILGYIETLGDEAGDEKELRERFLKIMFDEARRMQRLVEDLISLSRIEAEKYRLPDRAVDLAALIEEVRGGILDAQGENAVPIRADLAAEVPPVSGDAAQLSQVLHNLIGNAMKYGRKGAPVTIRLERLPTGMVRFAVSDEGDGIPAEHIPRLTERFYRVDTGRSRAAGGTGLGLSIVKHIVERHRGRLDIESTIGKGTTVAVMIPAHGSAVIKR